MITKLTKKQEAKIPYYLEKWLAIGKDTKSFDIQTAKPIIENLYKKLLGKTTVPPIVIMPNPIWTWYCACVSQVKQIGSQIRSQIGSQIDSQIDSQIRSQIGSQIRSQIGSQIDSQIGSQIYSQIRSQIDSQIYSQIRSQIYSQIYSQIRSQIGSQIYSQTGSQIGGFIWPYLDGQLCASYFSYYDFFFNELCECCCKEKYIYFRNTTNLHLIYPFDNIAVLCQKPSKITFKGDVLHNEKSPSIEYDGNFAVWSLNGVRVPQWLVETRSEEIDPTKIIEIDNAEVRREFVRKVGIDRICYKLNAKCLNKVGDYEILELIIKDRKYRYLKMLNPSIETWHVEGIPIEIDSVEKANNWRIEDEQIRNLPIDNLNGSDYYQQGDVLLCSEKAQSRKANPIILT
jgi:hypothetical protein